MHGIYCISACMCVCVSVWGGVCIKLTKVCKSFHPLPFILSIEAQQVTSQSNCQQVLHKERDWERGKANCCWSPSATCGIRLYCHNNSAPKIHACKAASVSAFFKAKCCMFPFKFFSPCAKDMISWCTVINRQNI